MRPWVAMLCAAALFGCASDPPHDAVLQAESFDLGLYAQHCKEEMGLPATPLAPMNCLDGVEIPVTVNGQRPDAATYEALVAGEIGCDNPSWIGDGEPCANYSFILNRQVSEDVNAVLFCRQRGFSSHLDKAGRRAAFDAMPTRENFEALFNFESLGLILTNTSSGATCFFERVQDTYGGHIVMPDDPAPPARTDLPSPSPPDDVPDWYLTQSAPVLWHPPVLISGKAHCASCHDSDPFIRSGHIHGLNVLPPHDTTRPYYLASRTGAAHQARNPPTALSTSPVQGEEGYEPQLCTTCHRIGGAMGCDLFSRYYTGDMAQPGQSPDLPFETRVLMPPADPIHSPATGAEWQTRYQAHVDKLLCCCENPNAIGCTLQDITQTPLPEPVAGLGPESCEL